MFRHSKIMNYGVNKNILFVERGLILNKFSECDEKFVNADIILFSKNNYSEKITFNAMAWRDWNYRCDSVFTKIYLPDYINKTELLNTTKDDTCLFVNSKYYKNKQKIFDYMKNNIKQDKLKDLLGYRYYDFF